MLVKKIKYTSLFLLILGLSSCYDPPVNTFSTPEGEQFYITECSGQLNDMNMCYKKAAEVCGNQQVVLLNKSQRPQPCYYEALLEMTICPVDRELQFKCK